MIKVFTSLRFSFNSAENQWGGGKFGPAERLLARRPPFFF